VRRLAVTDGDQAQPRIGGGQDGHRPPGAEHLVVGMGGDHNDAGPGSRVGGRQVPQLEP
jgi:hypothetical protein